MYISDCCGAEPDYRFSVTDMEGICSKCKEHCVFINEEEEENNE